jgi:hypothetical protein
MTLPDRIRGRAVESLVNLPAEFVACESAVGSGEELSR